MDIVIIVLGVVVIFVVGILLYKTKKKGSIGGELPTDDDEKIGGQLPKDDDE